MTYLWQCFAFDGSLIHSELREYFSVTDGETFCGTHHTLPCPLSGMADDGFGNPIARYPRGI